MCVLNAIEYYIIFLFLFFLLLLFVGYSPGWPSEVDTGDRKVLLLLFLTGKASQIHRQGVTFPRFQSFTVAELGTWVFNEHIFFFSMRLC